MRQLATKATGDPGAVKLQLVARCTYLVLAQMAANHADQDPRRQPALTANWKTGEHLPSHFAQHQLDAWATQCQPIAAFRPASHRRKPNTALRNLILRLRLPPARALRNQC